MKSYSTLALKTQTYFETQLNKHKDRAVAHRLLVNLSITADTARRLRIGFSPNIIESFMEASFLNKDERDLFVHSDLCQLNKLTGEVYPTVKNAIVFPKLAPNGIPTAFLGLDITTRRWHQLAVPYSANRARPALFGANYATTKLILVPSPAIVATLESIGIQGSKSYNPNFDTRDDLICELASKTEVIIVISRTRSAEKWAWRAIQWISPYLHEDQKLKVAILEGEGSVSKIIHEQGESELNDLFTFAKPFDVFLLSQSRRITDKDLEKNARDIIYSLKDGARKSLIINRINAK